LKASLLFRGVGESTLRSFAAVATKGRYEAGESIWRQGDQATAFVIVTRGLVEIERRGSDGTRDILAIFGPRESIGDAAALSASCYPAEALALGEVEVVRVPAAPVVGAMQREPEVAVALNRALLEHTRALREKIAIMTAGAVPRRLATVLLHLADRFGDERSDGVIAVPVVLSRAGLARLVGATLETTIRTMSRWQKAGLVKTTSEGFVLMRIETLEELAGRGAAKQAAGR
jgi:CRP-like cAMP-binding protein